MSLQICIVLDWIGWVDCALEFPLILTAYLLIIFNSSVFVNYFGLLLNFQLRR